MAARYRMVRALSERLSEPLEIEDYVVQSMADVSPTKWHLAHTSWFFETFVLEKGLPGYRGNPHYAFLFNSYYNTVGPMHCRPKRGFISRPTVKETYLYRAQTDDRMMQFFETVTDRQWQEFEPIIELGLHHEQQHQELLLMDIKHVFAQNPIYPVYRQRREREETRTSPLHWIDFPEGVYTMGNDGTEFCFDNEKPRHRVFLEPFQLASRLITNGEYLAFMEDGGYERPELWLSLGWLHLNEQNWNAPLYWEKPDGDWHAFTLSGLRRINPAEPVCHISYFEADAFARWAQVRLPTEAEWEAASATAPLIGNFVEHELYHPAPSTKIPSHQLTQMFGDLWEWTSSSYAPYPNYDPPTGALGEYNGKFMCNQYVLRGGCCATSQMHIRRTYRNFFAPDKRWPFSGIRLAKGMS
ncbi:MAG: ergothioneine biosynthesis protein EgtB [Verrucomicrobia bacterium]|nr:ergothioneine biosynthesis protein EgtB [Verrucomicrobiota bacterium]